MHKPHIPPKGQVPADNTINIANMGMGIKRQKPEQKDNSMNIPNMLRQKLVLTVKKYGD